MLDLLNVLNDVMRTDPWFEPFSARTSTVTATLHADVAETDNEYWIAAELPGVSLENVTLAIEADILTLTVDKRPGSNGEERNYHHVERRYGTFSRAFRLPRAVDRDRVEATMKDGVLSIRLPKAERARPRRIPVRAGTLAAGDASPRQLTAEADERTDKE